MVKGISRRVVVVDSPDQRFFEQAIFIVRNDAAGEGVTAQELVDEAVEQVRVHEDGAIELVLKYGDIYAITLESIRDVQEAM